MKIVVIGGTGLVGTKLVEKLSANGQDALAASPATGVDTITGEGLAEAVEGAQVVVDVRSEEHTSELQSRPQLVCRLLLEKKKPYHHKQNYRRPHQSKQQKSKTCQI